ncbi:hypothetical protein [Sulfurovum sp.]|uniref:hypothetical protein n=1 Tax=Sulfurovum sp. TaxID=1969726 RepID=UPI00356B1296
MSIGKKIFLTIFGLLVAAVTAFNIADYMYCSYDKKVKEVAFPLATAIIEHIENSGIPHSLKDISGMPYELNDCNKTFYEEKGRDDIMIEERENCSLNVDDKTYDVKIVNSYNDVKTYHVIDISIKQYKTKFKYSIRYDRKTKKWNYEHYPLANVYFDWDCWVCDPKLFRLTN